MTPKEKAKELINKFENLTISVPSIEEPGYILSDIGYNNKKECALIAVKELIEDANDWIDLGIVPTPDLPQSRKDYWYEVKQEIEKL